MWTHCSNTATSTCCWLMQQQTPVVDWLKLVLLTQVVDNCHSVCTALLISDNTHSLTSSVVPTWSDPPPLQYPLAANYLQAGVTPPPLYKHPFTIVYLPAGVTPPSHKYHILYIYQLEWTFPPFYKYPVTVLYIPAGLTIDSFMWLVSMSFFWFLFSAECTDLCL